MQATERKMQSERLSFFQFSHKVSLTVRWDEVILFYLQGGFSTNYRNKYRITYCLSANLKICFWCSKLQNKVTLMIDSGIFKIVKFGQKKTMEK